MDTLIETFHIDIKLLIAQAVNFVIVFGVLYYFILKPLLSNMEERSRKIAESLENADKIEEKLQQTDVESKEIVARAKKEAAIIVEEAAVKAENKKKEMIEKAKEEIGEIINKEKEKIRIEKDKTLKEIKKEVAGLVAVAAEKLLDESVDARKDEEIIRKTIKH